MNLDEARWVLEIGRSASRENVTVKFCKVWQLLGQSADLPMPETTTHKKRDLLLWKN
jgi:hypothetical protein